jgi:hypothetical protein
VKCWNLIFSWTGTRYSHRKRGLIFIGDTLAVRLPNHSSSGINGVCVGGG